MARTFRAADWAAAFRWLADKHGLTLAPEQEAGVRMALTAPVAILTGAPAGRGPARRTPCGPS